MKLIRLVMLDSFVQNYKKVGTVESGAIEDLKSSFVPVCRGGTKTTAESKVLSDLE